MEQEEAIKLLEEAHQEAEALKRFRSVFNERHTSWVIKTQFLLADIFGKGSGIYASFYAVDYQATGGQIFGGSRETPEQGLSRIRMEAYRNGLELAKGILHGAVEVLKRKGIETVYEPRGGSAESSRVITILSLVQRQLRKAIREIPQNETAVSNALETIFSVAELKFSREKDHIEYSSKTYIPDFTFPDLSVIVEVKLCNSERKHKDIISEINDDIVAYSTKYTNLIFVVYDAGIIRDVDHFKSSIEQNNNVIIEVVKH